MSAITTPDTFATLDLIPAPHAHAQQPAPRDSTSVEDSTGLALVNRPASRAATVLLAEDDRSLRRYLEVALLRSGFEVLVAADGLEAMKLALSSEIDVVVTDSVMPHFGGTELCRFLKGHPTLKGLPVVLLSARDARAAASDPDPRADLYLPKPVGPEELAACLSRLLERAG